MSFKGHVTSRKKINTPLGPGEIVTTEYDTPERKKVIWWMGEGKIVLLGELITYYMAEPRKSDFEKIKWKPYFFEVKLNEQADATEAVSMFFPKDEQEFGFDELEEAEEFINLIKCKTIKYGTIITDTRTEFKRWASVLKVDEENNHKS